MSKRSLGLMLALVACLSVTFVPSAFADDGPLWTDPSSGLPIGGEAEAVMAESELSFKLSNIVTVQRINLGIEAEVWNKFDEKSQETYGSGELRSEALGPGEVNYSSTPGCYSTVTTGQPWTVKPSGPNMVEISDVEIHLDYSAACGAWVDTTLTGTLEGEVENTESGSVVQNLSGHLHDQYEVHWDASAGYELLFAAGVQF